MKPVLVIETFKFHKTDLYYKSYSTYEGTILRSYIYILFSLHFKTCYKTRLKEK